MIPVVRRTSTFELCRYIIEWQCVRSDAPSRAAASRSQRLHQGSVRNEAQRKVFRVGDVSLTTVVNIRYTVVMKCIMKSPLCASGINSKTTYFPPEFHAKGSNTGSRERAGRQARRQARTDTDTDTDTDRQTDRHAHTHTYTRAHAHTHSRTRARTFSNTRIHMM